MALGMSHVLKQWLSVVNKRVLPIESFSSIIPVLRQSHLKVLRGPSQRGNGLGNVTCAKTVVGGGK